VARFRTLRLLRNALVYESREGRAAEVCGWSNLVTAVAAAAGTFYAARSVPVALAAGVAAFIALRLALAHRVTVWIAAAVGTLSVAAVGGAFAWVFAHVVDASAAPPIAAALGAIVAGALPALSYARVARRRAAGVRDSLLDGRHSLSLPPSSGA
jgi:hypothetical protein